jgi:hypothetical protein
MNPVKTFFSNLSIFSRFSLVGATHKEVVSFALMWLGSTMVQYLSRGLSRVVGYDATQSHQSIWHDWPTKMPPTLFLPPLSFFLPPPLSSCGGSIDDFGFLFANRSPWCHKSTPRVVIPIMLGTYVVFTLSFSCILKFSLGWTHVVGIQDEIIVFVISMKWLYCMND